MIFFVLLFDIFVENDEGNIFTNFDTFGKIHLNIGNITPLVLPN